MMSGPKFRVAVRYVDKAGNKHKVFPTQPVLVVGVKWHLHLIAMAVVGIDIEVHYKEVVVIWREPNTRTSTGAT